MKVGVHCIYITNDEGDEYHMRDAGEIRFGEVCG